MRRSTAASFVVVAFALLAVAGCDQKGGAKQDPPTPPTPPAKPEQQEQPANAREGGATGLFNGVVQIYKNGNLVACVTSQIGVGEYWITPVGQAYPIPCGAGDTLRFDYKDIAPADTNSDQTVSCQELLACSQYVDGLGAAKVIRRVTEVCVQLPGCQ